MQVEVHCSVSDCHYWGSGNYCHADKILVTSDAFADRAPDSVDAPRAGQIPATPTESCMETCCKTFIKKDSREVRADGVTRKG